ncbi:MAG TPA: pitrilysin family protein [Candidatus Limnocylindrales bacterium]|nr:pitrilysin family protein [Candidatus Limnocylindrales bacterium]
MFQRSTLPDGPRVISARLPSRSLTVAYYVPHGSRGEQPEEWGVAHFMEHLTFKGTAGLPDSRAVAAAIESFGGASNAATDRESTVYWVRLPARESERAFRVLSELTVRPLLRGSDIERERDIIVEEIRSYREDPSQFVFNLFDEAFFGDTPLGREIAGSEESVRGLTEDQVQSFWRRAYRPSGGVVAVAGDISHDDALALAVDCFGSDGGFGPPAAATPSGNGHQPAPGQLPATRLRIERRSCSQAHICIGLPALPRDHPDQWALELLNAVLGEGSGSRLFLNVREQAGLAYDVHSFWSDYADCGTLQVYAGVDPADQVAALRAILAELARLRDEPMPQDDLERARAYVSGRLELRVEESRHVASWLGVQETLHEKVLTVDDALAELAAVTPEQVHALAQRLIRDDALCLALISPSRGVASVERALQLP